MKKYFVLFILIITIFTLISCNDRDELQEILDSIEIPEEVTNNLELLDEYTLNGFTASASWHSTDSTVISSDGKIVVTLEDKSATLQLKLTHGERSLTKNFKIVVKGNTDLLVLYALYNTKLKNMETVISDDIELDDQYVQDGKTVSALWTSSNPEVLSTTGKVNRQKVDVKVTLTVTLRLNLAERVESFEMTVLRTEDSLPINYFHLASVFTGNILGEAADPPIPGCFPGAIYRKVVSSRDNWLGIEGVVTLGEFIPDPLRYDDTKLSYYLDNPSVYMGGNGLYESDIGLTWSIGHNSSTNTSLTRSGIAYRPFWRYITAMETGKRENLYRNANVSSYEYYYFPGDKLRMSVFSPKPDYLQMRIELIELTTIPKYVAQREKYNLGTDFNRVFTTDPFPSEGMGRIKSEFKRVNAIDQVGNEAKPTINTNSRVENAKWHEVYLYRDINGELYKVPLTENRSASMMCPLGSNQNGDFSKTFSISYEGVEKNLGGEIITLAPRNGTGKLYNSFNSEFIIPEDPTKRFI